MYLGHFCWRQFPIHLVLLGRVLKLKLEGGEKRGREKMGKRRREKKGGRREGRRERGWGKGREDGERERGWGKREGSEEGCRARMTRDRKEKQRAGGMRRVMHHSF